MSIAGSLTLGSSDAIGAAPALKRSSVKPRLADGSETDCRAGIHLAREVHLKTIFRDIAFSEGKARAIFDKAVAQPEGFFRRCGMVTVAENICTIPITTKIHRFRS
ncbi:hypothetical protein [Roseibium marinum]|uniref:hypothetical protein n=1 Tax=Roseibium marinum TaxID=281252 RepID=UPI000CD05907|nr:hypothetical protein [Roseibium marinum]